MKRLLRIWEKKTKIGMGLMSGTSVDGVDVALAEISKRGLATRAKLLSFETYPFDPGMRRRILKLLSAGAEEICEMNFLLGEVLADCALKFLCRQGLSADGVDFIGSHGQTVSHLSGHQERKDSSLQIGEGAVIAARTGILTICDFRPGDIAAGGTGAPLVPYADFILFRKEGRIRALQNIGGIANVTVVCEDFADLMAFDTGPGNMVLDGLVKLRSGGRKKWDHEGRIASKGKVDGRLLEELMSHPYLSLKPPKSTGREIFGEGFLKNLWGRAQRMPFEDLMATATYFTAASIHRSYQEFIFPRFAVDEIFISGGGMHNRTLLANLGELFRPIPLRPLNELGIPGDAKEALAFAILANETIHGLPANVPQATGARRPAVLGKIVF